MTKTTTVRPPSDKQVAFATDLTRDRDVKPGTDAAACLAELTRWFASRPSSKDVSDLIDRSLKAPRRTAPVVAAAPVRVPFSPVPASVPTAKFAVLTELLTEAPDRWRGQEYLFFEVKKLPRRERRVVNRLIGAPGSFQRHKLPAALSNQLLGLLEDDAFAYQASLTFAEVYTVCGRCAAELTDTDSRERKFGLHCWNLMAPYRAAAGL